MATNALHRSKKTLFSAPSQASNPSSVKQSIDFSRLQGALVAETEQVDNELKRVLEHRDALSRAIDVRMSIKAPIRGISPEVLTHILSFTIDIPVKRRKVDDSEDPILSMPWSIEPREHQLNTFQLVCKRWRRDILGCPSLWSQILIIANPHGTHSNAFRPKYTHYLKRQISRAGKNKLDIYIALLGNEVFYMTHLSPHILSVLEPVSARIRSLHITLRASMISDLIPLHKSLPSLEIINIHSLSPNTREAFPINLLGTTPQSIFPGTRLPTIAPVTMRAKVEHPKPP
ncbi:hypothetical protein CPB85DRAFT_1564090 [Mucidula mucida]|nr:hypothetical protein CPB85DRAFT_1564090 [Mucidula mucida]